MGNPSVADVLAVVDEIAPPHLAEEWDNVGLLLGDPRATVSGIMLSLDPSSRVLAEAVAAGCNLLISHHPVIFRPINALRRDRGLGKLYFSAVEAGVSMIAAHTNLDRVHGGVNDVLAGGLGLQDCAPLAAGSDPLDGGMGRIGNLAAPVAADEFIVRLADFCKSPALLVAGPLPARIGRVALCGGSGAELAETALAMGADIFITGEIKNSVARWAEEEGFCLVDAGHFSTENPVIKALAERLVSAFPELTIRTSEGQNGPLRLVTL